MGSFAPSEITKETIIDNVSAYNTVYYSYSQPHNGLKSYYNYPISSFEIDLDGDTINKSFSYDETKNYALKQSIVSHADGYTKTQYQSFVRRLGNYLPTRIIKETKYTGQNAFIEKEALSYNVNGLVVMDKKRFDTGHFMSTIYTYDSYGNIKTKKVIPENGSSLTTSYTCDSTKRFIVLMTEQVNKKTYYTYDNWGNILTKSDKTRPSYPQTTQYTYDGWNNVKTELSYTGQLTTYTRGWNSDGSSFLVTQGTGQPWKKECYDRLGKIIYEQSISVLNLALEDSFQYGQRGELVRHKSTKGSGTWQSDCSEYYEYDIRGRIKKIERSNNPTITYSYSPNTVTSTKNGQTIEKKYDLWGNIIKVTDSSGIVSYTYGSHGQPLEISYGGSTITMTYDSLGRKVSMNDPDAGTMAYTYDDFDRLITECDALNHQTQNTYDANGFLTQSVTDGIITNYTYGQQASNRFQLLSTTRGYCSINYTYDNLGRIESERRRINGGDTLETRYTYNNIGQLSTKQYVGGPTVTYTYDAYGFEDEIKCNNILISKPLEHTGAMLSEKRGTSLMKETWIYNNGKVSDLCMGSNVNMSNPDYWLKYYYDDGSGNLERRIGMFSWDEEFTYDSLDRLTLIEGNTNHYTAYTPDGNISYQTGIGHYYYDGTKPHAVTLVENTDHKIPFATLNTTYDSFGKIQTIENESGTTSISFVYGPDNERWKSVMNRPVGGTRTIYYMGDCEKIVENGHTRRLYYLDGDAIFIKQDNLSGSIYFTFKDNLGSIVAIVDYNGNEVFKAAYDAWGNRTLYRNDINFHRGYTGHEMLPEFGLINMNGRCYDPLLGRFLSTDNYVQEPSNSQSFNRYAYCLNNPLKYNDPTGEFFIGTIINAVKDFFVNTFINVWTQGINAWTNEDNWHSTYMSWKIDTGIFRGDPLQILSHLTWEAPQTILGYGAATIKNTFYDVKSVSYYGGATAVETYSEGWGGFTLGNYIIGNRGLYADPSNTLFQHEYGHYLQSQSLGPFYLQRCGIPSLFDAMGRSTHNSHQVEQDANIRAFKYFKNHVEGYDVKKGNNSVGWDMKTNRIDGYKTWLNYDDPRNQEALNKTLSLGWADYLFGPSVFLPGLLNIFSLHQ